MSANTPRPKNLPWDRNPNPPLIVLPDGAINTHCHVSSDGITLPWAEERKYDPDPMSYEELRALDAFLGFSGHVLVAATCHGTDNRMMVDSLLKSQGRAMGVAFVEQDIPDDELLALDIAGVRGVRYSYVKRLTTPPPPEHMIDMADRLQNLGLKWHIDLYCEAADLPALEPFIDAMPLPVMFDHMAVPDLKDGVNGDKFKLYMDILANRPDHAAKVTCPERITGSSKPEDWGKVLPYAQELIKNFPNQIVTGHDCPHPNLKTMVNDGDLVNFWIAAIAPTPELQQQILVANPRRYYNFGPVADRRMSPQTSDRHVPRFGTSGPSGLEL